jgi:hypothetical protein
VIHGAEARQACADRCLLEIELEPAKVSSACGSWAATSRPKRAPDAFAGAGTASYIGRFGTSGRVPYVAADSTNAMPSPRKQTFIWSSCSNWNSPSKDCPKDVRLRASPAVLTTRIATEINCHQLSADNPGRACEINRRQLSTSADKLQRRPRACEMPNRADGAAGTRRRWLVDRPGGLPVVVAASHVAG